MDGNPFFPDAERRLAFLSSFFSSRWCSPLRAMAAVYQDLWSVTCGGGDNKRFLAMAPNTTTTPRRFNLKRRHQKMEGGGGIIAKWMFKNKVDFLFFSSPFPLHIPIIYVLVAAPERERTSTVQKLSEVNTYYSSLIRIDFPLLSTRLANFFLWAPR